MAQLKSAILSSIGTCRIGIAPSVMALFGANAGSTTQASQTASINRTHDSNCSVSSADTADSPVSLPALSRSSTNGVSASGTRPASNSESTFARTARTGTPPGSSTVTGAAVWIAAACRSLTRACHAAVSPLGSAVSRSPFPVVAI